MLNRDGSSSAFASKELKWFWKVHLVRKVPSLNMNNGCALRLAPPYCRNFRIAVTGHTDELVVSFPDPAFKLDKGLAHFARNLGLADSALPEIWRTNQIAYTC